MKAADPVSPDGVSSVGVGDIAWTPGDLPIGYLRLEGTLGDTEAADQENKVQYPHDAAAS